MTGTKIYTCWYNMKQRCCNPNYDRYNDYGGRGIKVCEEWLDKDNGFMNFYNWAMQNGYQENLSIDRVDNDGNYEPSNCRWTDTHTQRLNQRPRRRKIKFDPVKDCIEALRMKYYHREKTRLSKEDIIEIKSALDIGVSGAELGRIFKVSRQTINNIKLDKH